MSPDDSRLTTHNSRLSAYLARLPGLGAQNVNSFS